MPLLLMEAAALDETSPSLGFALLACNFSAVTAFFLRHERRNVAGRGVGWHIPMLGLV